MSSALLAKLESLVGQDLLYSGASEEDYPVRVFYREPAAGDVHRVIADLHPGQPLAEGALDEFFDPVTAVEDWPGEAPEAAAVRKQTAERFKTLQRLIGAELNDPTVLRVGAGASQTVYVLGRSQAGEVLGIQTAVVES